MVLACIIVIAFVIVLCHVMVLANGMTSYKNTVSARKLRLMQFYPLHHHGIRAEPSHRTFDFSNHDHHIKAFEDSHSSTQYWVQVIRIPGTGRKAISEYHEQIWH